MNPEETIQTYTAFAGPRRLAHGTLDDVVLKVKRKYESDVTCPILVFSDATGKNMDFDLSGSEKHVVERLKVYRHEKFVPASGPGRPKLGVVSREISLLPRHWEWLAIQSGGASATIRRLIDQARKNTSPKDNVRRYQERTYNFLLAMAGDLPQYEEALRALFGKNEDKFHKCMTDWPADIVKYAIHLAAPVFSQENK